MSMLRESQFNRELLKNRFLNGTVESDVDPAGVRRVKVRFRELFDENVPTDQLPWCMVLAPVGTGASRGTGSSCVPGIGTGVCVMFDNGDINSGVIMGELPSGKGVGVPGFHQGNSNRPGWGNGNTEYYIDIKSGELKVKHFGVSMVFSKTGEIKIDAANKVTETAAGQRTLKQAKLVIESPMLVQQLATFVADILVNNISFLAHTHPTPAGDSGPPK